MIVLTCAGAGVQDSARPLFDCAVSQPGSASRRSNRRQQANRFSDDG